MVHTISHDLDDALTRRTLDAAFLAYKARFTRYDPTLRWEDEGRARFGFRVQGRELGGTVRLLPGALEISMEVPLMLRLFEGRARRAVESEVLRWIDRARAGEFLAGANRDG